MDGTGEGPSRSIMTLDVDHEALEDEEEGFRPIEPPVGPPLDVTPNDPDPDPGPPPPNSSSISGLFRLDNFPTTSARSPAVLAK